MKKFFLALLFTLASSATFAVQQKDCSSLVYGKAFPQIVKPVEDTTLLCRKMYVVRYSPSHKTPVWSAEHLIGANLDIAEKRVNAFKTDPDLPKAIASTPKDYAKSGFDQGHNSPVGDMHSDADAMLESFYMSNMVPQVPQHNREFWKTLEEKVREYAKRDGELYVITGPVYTTAPLKTIGVNKVAIPDFIYKVVYNPKTNNVLTVFSPNTKLTAQDLPRYCTTLAKLEATTGIKFFPLLKHPPYDKDLMTF